MKWMREVDWMSFGWFEEFLWNFGNIRKVKMLAVSW